MPPFTLCPHIRSLTNDYSGYMTGGTDVILLFDASIVGEIIVNAATMNTYCYAINIIGLLKARS